MVDCHIHMVLSGDNWKAAIDRHRNGPQEDAVRMVLAQYHNSGFTYLRDGGDRWGAGLLARELAPGYGICYRTPCAPLCLQGHYGSFIGRSFTDVASFRQQLEKNRADGCDFIKVMISGLMDFDNYGVLSEPGISPELIGQMIHICHEEGFSVMAHANGADTVLAAAQAGVDSIEHGAYLTADALQSMAESRTVWVPTLSAIGNLRRKGRFREEAVQAILDSAAENIRAFAAMGGLIAPGSDAGAWAVPHAGETEYELLKQCLGTDYLRILNEGTAAIISRF